jgi:hypothetical protein
LSRWLICTSIAEAPPAWAVSRALENFALTLGEDDEADDSDDEEGPRYRVAAAAKSIKLDIKELAPYPFPDSQLT